MATSFAGHGVQNGRKKILSMNSPTDESSVIPPLKVDLMDRNRDMRYILKTCDGLTSEIEKICIK